MADIEAGYYLCCVGGVVSKLSPGRTTTEVLALRTQLVAHSREEIAGRKSMVALSSQLRTDVEWFLPHNAFAMMHGAARDEIRT